MKKKALLFKDFLVDKMKYSLNNLNSSLDELLQMVSYNKNDLKKQKKNLNFNTIFQYYFTFLLGQNRRTKRKL
jgi:hypothetical protein